MPKFAPFLRAICLCLPVLLDAHAAQDCVTPARVPTALNVMDTGARADGKTDDTRAIQSAIDKMASTGGTVFLPDGTYLVDALVGILIRDDMTLRLSDAAILKAIPNARDGYNIVRFEKVSNANLIGGILHGERDAHLGKSGEWGMGVYINGSSNIAVQGTTARNAWGDGFYIRGASTNIRFCSVVADNNRRQGMSIISVNGLVVKDSIFKNTNGTAPQAGLDIEPNENDTVRNVQIVNSKFVDNRGIGIQIYLAPKINRLITGISVEGNTVTANQAGGIWIKNSDGNIVQHNTVSGNQRFGILFAPGTNGNSAINNILDSSRDLVDQGSNTIIGNRILRQVPPARP